MLYREVLRLDTDNRQTIDITKPIQNIINGHHAMMGLCNIFIPHTSASLMICENADPQVRKDLEAFFSRLIPDGDPLFKHNDEGPDDMPAHIRTILTQCSLNIPFESGALSLGRWQGIYLYEHRFGKHQREIIITVHGIDT